MKQRRFLAPVQALLGCLLLGLLGPGARAQQPPVKVVATLPVLADLARQVGGGQVDARSLARGSEDPHYVVPTPSLMAAVNRADLFVEVGLSLELWAERVLDGARNAGIRRSAKGHVFAAKGVPLKQVPASLTRAKGDLHPDGNPHIWVDPVNLEIMAANIAEGLQKVAPARKEIWQRGLKDFQRRMDLALYGKELPKLLGGGRILNRLARGGKLWSFLSGRRFKGQKLSKRAGGWLAKAAPLRGRPIIFYHQSWVYFADRFGLAVEGYVEDKPGILPSAAHKEALVKLMRERKIKLIGVLNYYDDTVAQALSAKTGARVALLPGDVGAMPEAKDVFSMIDQIITRLLAISKEP